jgi:hypothetical protein
MMAEDAMSDEELSLGDRIRVEEILIPVPAGAPPISTLVLRPTAAVGRRRASTTCTAAGW